MEDWARTSFNVTFQIFDQVEVYGKNVNPLFQWLQDESGELIIFNYGKFLINEKGHIL